MNVVHIRWSKLYNLSEINHYEEAFSKGIYAIYRVYRGKEKLLYIGKTKRSFSKRLHEHYKDWIHGARGIHVRLGILEFPNGGKYSEQKLSDVEALLISWHTPLENTQCTNYYIGRENLEVISFGQRGLIDKKITTQNYEWA
ncbi:hypothetical protein BACERE00185_05051 [Bacillus mobilis]|uniref:GIY-YIG domain-containing protein n=1 Tax=Bacillus mobilis TaxID=2026190 RepID=A0A1Y6AR68_9BACI|nr:GIY-YIG nuclease family protein [Bacillus mobilis]SME46218.1 hypothetical protein BACERE00185_05051 [Bacillus mobilis]